MADIRISLSVYSSDIAHRVMNLSEEIPDEEIEDLKDFISGRLMGEGNPGVFDTLVWGIRAQYLLWRETKDYSDLMNKKADIYRQATDTRGHVY